MAEPKPNPFSYEITTPDQVSDDTLRQLQVLEREAYGALLTDQETYGPNARPQSEVDTFIHWDDFGRYAQARRDPNVLVGNGLRANQEYYDPHMVIASTKDGPVGLLETVVNVSGHPVLRAVKRHLIGSQYVWAQTAAVHPSLQRKGIATNMLAIECANRDYRMNATAYLWPEFNSDLYGYLQKLSFDETDSFEDKPLGPGSHDLMVARMEGRIGIMKRRFVDAGGSTLAIREALKTYTNNLPQ